MSKLKPRVDLNGTICPECFKLLQKIDRLEDELAYLRQTSEDVTTLIATLNSLMRYGVNHD